MNAKRKGVKQRKTKRKTKRKSKSKAKANLIIINELEGLRAEVTGLRAELAEVRVELEALKAAPRGTRPAPRKQAARKPTKAGALPPDASIAVLKENPHRAGTKDAASFDRLKTAATVADALAALEDRNYLRYAIARGFVVVGPVEGGAQ